MSLKRITLYKNQSQPQQQSSGLEFFKGKRFYCGNNQKLIKDHCCFNHFVGLPEKDNGQVLPLFDYEAKLYQAWKQFKHLWILKATGLGVTEFFLRLMLWLATTNDQYQGCQFCLVVGPNIDLAKKLIRRMRNILRDIIVNSTETDTQTAIEINKVWIQAFPSNHLDAYRSLDKPKFIFLDEADFFRKGEQEDVRHVSERYIGKSNPSIIMVSTPNRPDGLMKAIEEEEPSIYHKIKLGYQVGLNKIYNDQDIVDAKESPGFDREYNLQYLGRIGNVFSSIDIETAIQLGEQYKGLEINPNNLLLAGVDPAFGSSSKAALTMVEFVKEHDIVRVVLSKEWDQSTPSAIAKYMHELHANHPTNLWFYIDGSGRSLINEAKVMFNESIRWDKEKDVKHYSSKIIPINFVTEHRKLLEHCHYLVSKGRVAIPKEYTNLITSLRTAWAEEWNLNKDESVANDHLDALRLALREIKFSE